MRPVGARDKFEPQFPCLQNWGDEFPVLRHREYQFHRETGKTRCKEDRVTNQQYFSLHYPHQQMGKLRLKEETRQAQGHCGRPRTRS